VNFMREFNHRFKIGVIMDIQERIDMGISISDMPVDRNRDAFFQKKQY